MLGLATQPYAKNGNSSQHRHIQLNVKNKCKLAQSILNQNYSIFYPVLGRERVHLYYIV